MFCVKGFIDLSHVDVALGPKVKILVSKVGKESKFYNKCTKEQAITLSTGLVATIFRFANLVSWNTRHLVVVIRGHSNNT